MSWYDYQAKKAKVDAPERAPIAAIPEIKLEELPPLGFEEGIKVEESTPSDTFIGRIRADIRKLWGGQD